MKNEETVPVDNFTIGESEKNIIQQYVFFPVLLAPNRTSDAHG
jgi:hypothetical protein